MKFYLKAISLLSFAVVLPCALALLGSSRVDGRDSRKISWPDYKNDYIDPISSSRDGGGGSSSSSHLVERMDPATRQVSDQFWLAQYAEEKEKLHKLNKAAAAAMNHPEEEGMLQTPATSYDSYKAKYIDPMEKRKNSKSKSDLKGHMDPTQRAESDQFWLETFMEEKARLHGNRKIP